MATSVTGLAERLGRLARAPRQTLRGKLPRHVYTHMREVIDLRTTVARRLYARRVAERARFEIPRSRGLLVFPPGHFAEVSEIVQIGREAVARADIGQRARSTKPTFMIPTLEQEQLGPDSPLIRFALRDDVLTSISAYLGTVPVLKGVEVFYSEAAGGDFKSSQLFHFDADALTQVKIFVLCSDVTPANGPLTVMEARTSRVLKRALKVQGNQRVADEDAFRVVGDADRHVLTGPAGTVCFVDTSSCFHYGSRITGESAPRTVVVFQYLPIGSYELPGDYRKEAPYRHLANSATSPLARLALGAD
jgi:hypothetical protein